MDCKQGERALSVLPVIWYNKNKSCKVFLSLEAGNISSIFNHQLMSAVSVDMEHYNLFKTVPLWRVCVGVGVGEEGIFYGAENCEEMQLCRQKQEEGLDCMDKLVQKWERRDQNRWRNREVWCFTVKIRKQLTRKKCLSWQTSRREGNQKRVTKGRKYWHQVLKSWSLSVWGLLLLSSSIWALLSFSCFSCHINIATLCCTQTQEYNVL